MGLTLIAILTAALLLPGIVATGFFYRAGQTYEVDAVGPSLTSASGIARIGSFSILVHLLYAGFLHAVASLPPLVQLPLADPYRPFGLVAATGVGPPDMLSVLLGLTFLIILAVPVGYAAGWCAMRWSDRTVFYGPLAEIISQSVGDDKVIVAYVLIKLDDDRKPGKHIVGYQGVVSALIRDEDRFPAKLVLKDASVFYLELGATRPIRHETGQIIDWIALSASEWHNVAFKVFQIVDDSDGQTG